MDLLIASPKPEKNGYTWTMASRLGEMLNRAEELFGPRDLSYTIIGVEFCADGPQLWYPGSRRHIVIQLSVSCLTDRVRAYYQLAHECIHLLAPSGGRNANVLEEGLATYFSELYVQETFGNSMKPELASYAGACELVRQLLTIDECFVLKLRAKQPTMHLTRVEDIWAIRPDVPRELAESLVAPFVRQ